MNFNTISNQSYDRAKTTYSYIWWDNLFTNEEIDKMSKYFASQGTDTAKVSTAGVVNKKIRVSEVKFHTPTVDNQWIFERFNTGIKSINDQFYGFDLNGYDSLQYSEYRAKNKGKYNWHADLSFGPKQGEEFFQTRKLSLSFLLNEPGVDFEGGEFELHCGNHNDTILPEFKKGRIIAFPSFVAHRVRPVTNGIRKSIVIWLVGPKFK